MKTVPRPYASDGLLSPDMSETLKDTAEVKGLIERRLFSVEQESPIRDEAARMVRTIESVGRPFCDGWPDWRPDASWSVPRLPDDWFDVDGTEAGTS